eukprot:TRINITY_DN18969_c0_g1_i1.p1 TRINITY_DN18969_c0_g1~~TRINITY_DN18969_c0_g1_i1.p1  ORF type:complete len:110 (+),score=5.13 TRINITY_DN18969_c0_g1_i1:45-332(+)
MAFLHDCCDAGSGCGLLHVRRKKCNLGERYEQFGVSVLRGVSRGIQRKAKQHANESSIASPQASDPPTGPPQPLPIVYTHCPYSWGTVTPPEFMR